MASPFSPDDLPVHFFTIVLNGEPFIRYHLEAFQGLPFRWHWHIIEGVAKLVKDTSWSVSHGGKIPETFHHQGLSKDGTSEYLDQLARDYPENITIHRKAPGEFWEGKLEMVRAPLASLPADCLLWQIDADELWSRVQIEKMRQLFLENPKKTAAWFWCHFFVGPGLVISSRNTYGGNPQIEWLRVWRYRQGMEWASHEPPKLTRKGLNGLDRNVGTENPFLHYDMQKQGLIFQHFAYALPEQLAFKESYYGYKNAVADWRRLQASSKRPLMLRDYFSWVRDQATVDSVEALSITPIASLTGGKCRFLAQDEIKPEKHVRWEASPRIIIDGIYFQNARNGIARVWESLFREWARTRFAENLLILDRDHTAPRIEGLRYHDVPAFDKTQLENDNRMLQQICDLEEVDLFISTFNTFPTHTPISYLVHDMIPELLEHDPNPQPWIEKSCAILGARSIIAVSRNSAQDLHDIHPHIPLEQIRVAHPGVDPVFHSQSQDQVIAFRQKHGLTKPYFLVVGTRSSYKNIESFFRAFSQLPTKEKYEIVCVGGRPYIEANLSALVDLKQVNRLDLKDDELVLAYAGAIALVYPSLYEGFGLPVLEAMASGCPVITSPISSLPEVAEDAAIYVSPKDVDGLVKALDEVQRDEIRTAMIEKGLKRAGTFSWRKMAEIVEDELRQTVAKLQDGTLKKNDPVFQEMRKLLLKSYSMVKEPTIKERYFKLKVWGKHRLKVSLYR